MHLMYTTLIEPAQLAAMLGEERLAVIDCRHDLARPEWGAEAWANGHIPGAVHASLDRDLAAPVQAGTGRHPLPDPAVFADTLGRWGIDEHVQVVAYDQGSGAYAARLWWMLRWLGHFGVAVLNGGFAAWQALGLPVTREVTTRAPRRFVPRAAGAATISTAELEQRLPLERSSLKLIDARSADRFAGENETIDPVAGHIPGALNRPFTQNLDSQGRFLPPETLRREWEQLLGGGSAKDAACMCGSGVTACHNLLALEIAGLSGARLYAGSWSEWIRDAARPVARGRS